ncbi:IclR family transcriptional regulator domain-containing protein [Paracidovorax citrulli]
MPDAGAKAQKKEELLDSLTKGLALLRLFASGTESLSMQDVADRLEVTRAAARRLLLTLEHNGYLAQQGRQFVLTPRVMDLGYAYFASMSLPRLAQPHLRALAARCGETCSVAMLDGEDVVLVAREEPRQILRVDMAIGRRMPAYAHSLGRVLLAGLDEDALKHYLAHATLRKLTPFTVDSPKALSAALQRVRKDGYAVLVSELMDGFAGISVPLRDQTGKVVAGIGFSMVLGSRKAETLVERYLSALQQTAAEIEAVLRGR